MADLGPQYQNLSYQGLLQVPGGITASLQQVQDGDGNPTGLYLSSTGVSVSGFVATTAQNIVGGTAGSILYQTGASTTGFVAPGFAGYVLVSNGASAPSWSNTAPHALTSNATTNLAGGTAGAVPYQSAAGVTSYVSPGSVGQVLTSSGLGPPVWAAAPSSIATALAGGSAGQIAYQTGANTTGFVSAGTYGQFLISNGTSAPFWATVIASSLGALAIDGSNSMTAALNMAGYKVTNLATPTAATDAATKSYVDSVATGLNVKAACTVATTGNITLSGIQSVDGVPVGAGQRVLVKNQTNAAENGIYDSASGAWTRSSDADSWSELVGATVFIEYGAINDLTTWVCNVTAGGTLGTTPVVFVQFSATQSYTAGVGLTLVGNEFRLISPVSVSNGGTGVSSLTGVLYGNAGAPVTTATGAQIASAIGMAPVLNASFAGTCSGNSQTATALQTARTINGVAFDGTTNITIPSTSTYSVTFNDSGSGAASGVTYNGSTAQTISYNTVGAPSTIGTNASGTWPINITGNAATATNAAGWIQPSSYTYTTNFVGINKTIPVYNLDVQGVVNASGNFNPGTSSWTLAAFRAAGSYGGGLSFVDGTAGWALWTDAAGALLNIGQSSTSAPMSTKWTINSAGALALGGNYGTAGQVLTSSGGGAMTWSPGGGASQWTTSGSNIYYNTGNVGFNNASPTQRIDVTGTVRSTGSFYPITSSWTNGAFRADGSWGGAISLIDGAAGWGIWAESSGDNINFGQGSTSGGLTKHWTINSSGALALAGNYGTAGQVLTSSGGGAMTWSSAGGGSSTYVVVSGFTTAAINAAIATAGAGGTIFLPAGTYSITSTITLNDINVIGSGYSTILQGSTASLGSANPMFVLTGIVTIKSLKAQFDVKPVSASSGQYVIFRTGNGSNPLQRYSNIDSVFTGNCGTAFYNPSGVGSVFSTTFSNLRVEFFTYRGFDFNGTDRTGNVYSNIYIAAGIPSAGVLNTCNCLFALSGFESECTIQQLNLEHSIFTQACAIFNGIGAISCSTLHVEQVKPASNNIPYIYTNGSSGTFTAFTFLGNWYPAYSMPTTTGNSIFQMNSCLSTYSSPSPTTANYFNIGEFYIANSATTLGWNMFARGTNDGPMYVEIGGYQYTPSDNYYANFPTSGNIEFISSGVNASFNQPVRKINGQTTFKNDGLTVANTGATTVFERPTNGSLMQMYIGGVASGQLYTTSGGTPALFSGSDYRLKENIQPIADACARMKLVQAYTYNMIGNDALHQGFLAHELQQVCDHAVIGEKDAFDKDGKPIYQQVATTMLIPLMSQAVKEILVRLDALESKINSMQQ